MRDGTTRILNLWDQTIPADSVADPFPAENGETSFLGAPSGYFLGTEFTRAVIDRALEQTTERERFALCPSRDISGHGTHVTGIAAGNGRASQGRYRGVAYESPLLIVKIGNAGGTIFSKNDGTDAGSRLLYQKSPGIRDAHRYKFELWE